MVQRWWWEARSSSWASLSRHSWVPWEKTAACHSNLVRFAASQPELWNSLPLKDLKVSLESFLQPRVSPSTKASFRTEAHYWKLPLLEDLTRHAQIPCTSTPSNPCSIWPEKNQLLSFTNHAGCLKMKTEYTVLSLQFASPSMES